MARIAELEALLLSQQTVPETNDAAPIVEEDQVVRFSESVLSAELDAYSKLVLSLQKQLNDCEGKLNFAQLRASVIHRGAMRRNTHEL